MLKSKLTIPWLAVWAAAGLCAFAIVLPAQDIAPPPDGSIEDGGGAYEALARGPMHEAFANPYTSDPEPGVIVEEQPPEPIDEVTPDQMPEGDNVVWIPGYWGWDPESSEFIWISGLWRNVAGDQRWVPGYWAPVNEGFQWVAGFWTTDTVNELAYLPTPPESLEQGPNIAPPEGDFFWIPGCWMWETSDYQWRPGYWAPAVADWIWIPDQYVWTPYGCVFVAGHWDFDVIHRGLMFAPIAFREPVYRQPNFRYTPTVAINSAPLLLHLFVNPGYSHYFYGNYYGYQPNNFGFYPWYAYGQRRNFYDPMLTYYQWSYAQRNVNLIQRLSSWNGYFAQNQSYRPPRTFAAQRQFAQQFDRSNSPVQLAALTLASPLSSIASSQDSAFAFARVADSDRQRFAERTQSLRQFQRQRSEFESAEEGRAAAQAPGDQPRGEGGRRRGGPGAPAQRKLQLPEATAVAQGPAAQPGDAGGPDRPGRGRGERRQPPALPTPDANRGGRPDGAPGDNAPGRNRPDAPGQNRPGAETPGNVEPGADRPGRGRPDASRPGGERPGADQPGSERPGAGRPGAEGPNADRPDRGRPGTPDAGEGPAFPRFGVGRNRPDAPGAAPGEAPGAAAPGAAVPGRGQAPGADQPARGPGRGRGGFDPFDSRPPGGEAPDANANAPGRNRPTPGGEGGPNRGRRPGAGTPRPGAGGPGAGAPGAGAPGAGAPGAGAPGAGAPGAGVPGAGLPGPGAARPEGPGGQGRTRPNLPGGAPALPGQGAAARPGGNAGPPAGAPGGPGRGNAGRPDRGGSPAAPGVSPRPAPQAPAAGAPGPGASPRPNPEGGGPKVSPGGGPPQGGKDKDKDKGKKPKA